MPEAERVGRVFPLVNQRTGKPFTRHVVGEIVARIGHKAGVVTDKAAGRFATLHDLRRSCLSRWARKVTPAVLQKVARHAHYTTTQAYYVHLDAADLAAELWERFGPEAGNGELPPRSYGNTLGNTRPETAENRKAVR